VHYSSCTFCPLAAFALEIFLIAIGIFPCAPRGHLSFACGWRTASCGLRIRVGCQLHVASGMLPVGELYRSSWSATVAAFAATSTA